MHSVSTLMGQMNNALVRAVVPPLSPSVFYIHYVFLFPMKLVAYSSAVWQIRCAVKWSMTESRRRLDPLQSYPAITISSFLWGNTQGRERKLDQILLKKAFEWQGERDETEHFPFLPKHLWICPGIRCIAVFGPGYAEYIKLNIYSGCTVAQMI